MDVGRVPVRNPIRHANAEVDCLLYRRVGVLTSCSVVAWLLRRSGVSTGSVVNAQTRQIMLQRQILVFSRQKRRLYARFGV